MQIELTTMKNVAEDISSAAKAHHENVGHIIKKANATLREESIDYGGLKQLRYTPTPFVLSERDYTALLKAGEDLHGIIEKVLQLLASNNPLLRQHFASHSDFLSYLVKPCGKQFWQTISRYDFILTNDGNIKFIELNTCCPAGFFYQRFFDSLAKRFPICDSKFLNNVRFSSDYARPEQFVRIFDTMEHESGIEEGTIGVLYDENKLMMELDLIRDSILSTGRKAAIVDARELECNNGKLSFRNKRISSTYNKFRVCGNQNHHWRSGFQQRYSALLHAIQNNSFIPINNFAAMVFSEDKGMLAVLTDPKFANIFTKEELEFILKHIPHTQRLSPKTYDPFARQNEQYVLKPANDGRGQGVVIGCEVSNDAWKDLIAKCLGGDYIIQEHIEPLRLPVVYANNRDEVMVQEMYHTGAIFVLNGKASGFLSRVSTNRITNVGVEGYLQPIISLTRSTSQN